jgi:lambda repressor-like predicted transcriptional regulator
MTQVSNLMEANLRAYIEIQNAFEQCDPDIQEVIKSMLLICRSDEASDDEKKRAMTTVIEGLFPGLADDISRIEQSCIKRPEAIKRESDLDSEEATFADRLQAIMNAKELKQEELAELTGVSQPAISNMLNRNCRPQKRTILRFAEALGVSPSDLWPDHCGGDL